MAKLEAKAPAIGHVQCPACKRMAVVRKKTNGLLYIVCAANCGLLNMTGDGGQEWILENATVWGAGGPPATLPYWIKANLAHAPKDAQSPTPPAELPETPAPAVETPAGEVPTLAVESPAEKPISPKTRKTRKPAPAVESAESTDFKFPWE